MKLKNKFLSLILIVVFTITTLIGCTNKSPTAVDREGNKFKQPKKVNTIISTAPSNTEILVGLGLSDKLVAIDKYSADIDGVNKDLPKIDFKIPDAETLLSLKPDIIIASGHNKTGNEDPFAALKEAGIEVVYIPTSSSIEDIYKDIGFIAKVTSTEKKGQEMINNMKSEIDSIKKVAASIIDKKTVYFEIGSTSALYSFGNNTFLNEIIEIIGAKNIFANENSWISPTPEAIVKANPDVILTNEPTENAVDAIKIREGFKYINAIKENNVFAIDNNSSSRPSQNIMKALKEIAKAIYPDKYSNV